MDQLTDFVSIRVPSWPKFWFLSLVRKVGNLASSQAGRSIQATSAMITASAVTVIISPRSLSLRGHHGAMARVPPATDPFSRPPKIQGLTKH